MTEKTIIGRREIVRLPELKNDAKISAKIDTGAFGSALHCEKISLLKDGTLEYQPIDKKTPIQTATKYRNRQVKSSSGHVENRYVITTKVVIMGKSYDIEVSLTDRSGMRWPMLIGRKFIGDNKLLVDVRRYEGKYPANLEKE